MSAEPLRPTRWRPVLLVTLGTALLSSPAAPQALITLDGIVQREGGGVAGAEVTAVDPETNERRRARTNELGYFRIIDLAPGRYEVTVRRIGYAPVREAVPLLIGQRVHLRFEMRPAALLLDPVAVREFSAQVAELQRTSVSTVVTEQEIRDLPLNTRNVLELAGIVPGIRAYQPSAGRAIPSAGALRDERFINMYVDGLETKNLYDGNLVGFPQSGSPLPADAVQEFRVFINPYDAEYARGAAYVISAVTRRGTNVRAGSAFAYYQDRNLVSVNAFQRSIANFEKPNFRRQQRGFSLRGPVFRDRLFYAASYELSNTDNYVAVVPGRPAADPTHWDSYAGVFRAPNRNHAGVVRLTYAPGEASTFDAIWSSRLLTGEWMFGGSPPLARNAAAVQRYSVHTGNLRHRWTPHAQFANEASLQFVVWRHRDLPHTPSPELIYPTLQLGRASGRFEITEGHVRIVNRATYSLGSGPGGHLLKGGVELARVTADQTASMLRYGRFFFRDVDTPPDRAIIAVGINDPGSENDARVALSGWTIGAYANDEWQIGSRVLLNLGIRYDAEINTLNNRFVVPWSGDTILNTRPELDGLLNRGNRRNDLNNVSPRVSISWDAFGTGRLYARAGWGIIYDRVPAFIGYQERRSATWRSYVFLSPGTTDPDELRRRVTAGGGNVPPSITLLPDKMEAPQNSQWSVGAGLRLSDALTVNTDFIDQNVRKLFANRNLNWLDGSEVPPKRVLTPNYGDIVVWGDFARARYRGLLTRITYSPAPDRRVDLSHTFASARADWDVANAPVPAAAAAQYYVLQRTSGDERHRFVLTGVRELPFGLRVSTAATIASPRPFRTVIGVDVNRNGFDQDDWIDGRRYTVPAGSWRNWYRVVDLRLTQPVRTRGSSRILLTAEAFNLFNWVNYAGFFDVQRSASGEPRPDFAQPSAVFAPRQVQVGVRTEFGS
jgi:hypothetical protein